MAKERTPQKPREEYRLRTRLIHGSFATGKWDYDHHVVPPQSSSATYRLSSVHRGAQGFVEFATAESRRAPIYIYDRPPQLSAEGIGPPANDDARWQLRA